MSILNILGTIAALIMCGVLALLILVLLALGVLHFVAGDWLTGSILLGGGAICSIYAFVEWFDL